MPQTKRPPNGGLEMKIPALRGDWWDYMNYSYYEVLMVTRDAPPEVIRAAYKALLQKWHPDRNSHESAQEITALLNRAYAELSDPEKRCAYDEWLASEVDAFIPSEDPIIKGAAFEVDENKASPALEKLNARARWNLAPWQKRTLWALILGGIIS